MVCRYQPMTMSDVANTQPMARDVSNVMRFTERGEHHVQSTSTYDDSEAKQDELVCNGHDVLLLQRVTEGYAASLVTVTRAASASRPAMTLSELRVAIAS